VVRATTFLICAGGFAACGLGSTTGASAKAPSVTAVVNARFAVPVDLDHGGLLVSPPPARTAVAVTEREAEAMFRAADAVRGPHAFAIFGLGLVTVAPRLERPAPTTTTTTPGSPAPSTTSSTTGPTTTVSSPTTTAPPAPPTTTLPGVSPSTAVPLPTAVVPTTTLPRYQNRLAWVGIVWGAPDACPGSTTSPAPSPGATSYVAVVIDAQSARRVLAYRSGGSSPCTGAATPAAVSEPNELLSVPWQPVGPASTAVQIDIPACGSYYGWTQVTGAGGAVDDQVVVSVPFDPTCGSTEAQSQAVDQVVPLGPGQALVGHAAVGPIQALQALPGD